MGESLLEGRVRRFRHGAYLGTAFIVGWLAVYESSIVLAAGAAAFLLAPHVLGRLQRSRFGPGHELLQASENVVTACAVTTLGVPLVPAVAVFGALLTGTVAQQGFRGLGKACGAVLVGAVSGAMLRAGPPLAGTMWIDAMGLLLIVAYTTPLSALGFEETMKMHRARSELRTKTQELERLCERLSRYLAPSVYRRIVEERSPMARLRRVYVTVCFIDLADFTGLTERLAPEELAILLNDFLFEVSALAAGAGGTVDKFLGDGVLVYFGDPASRGPPADARACVEMTRQLDGVLATLLHRWRVQGIAAIPAVRTGVASGFCTVGDFGGASRLDHTIVGKAVNLASRLKDEARLGEVLVSETVRLLIEDCVADTNASRRVSLKGFPAPVEVLDVNTRRNGGSSARIDGAGAGP